MRYKLDLSQKLDLSSTPASGYGGPPPVPFYAWQPSTWPAPPQAADEAFIETLKRIFEDSILSEINNVIADAQKRNGDLQHRGHVVAIALLCALDAISSYGYGARCGKQIPDFVRAHFAEGYVLRADGLLTLYRHAMVHSWNLFQAAISPGDEPVAGKDDQLSFGLLNFFKALVEATENFLDRLARDKDLQAKTLARYSSLQKSARP